jgi:hypothetical protein
MSVENLEARLLRLETSTRDELASEWVKTFGIPAPRKSSREFLLKAIGHRLQTEVYGDLKPSTRKTLLKIAEQIRAGGRLTELPTPKRTLKPGSRLIRAWRGETHEVIVAADGHFEWRGERHRSLSHIATTITGTRRNGPAFFGLREAERRV